MSLPLPEISRFYGIVVAMFFNDHDPPHFHARYGEHKVIVSIESLELLVGSLPRRAEKLLLEWARMHQGELREDWRRARAQESLLPIDPLE